VARVRQAGEHVRRAHLDAGALAREQQLRAVQVDVVDHRGHAHPRAARKNERRAAADLPERSSAARQDRL
jgi:hypothetical protein